MPSVAGISMECARYDVNFPETEKTLKARISSYKSSLNREKKIYGHIDDGSGKRYLLFCLYFVLGDLKRARDYFEWYKAEFPDDIGEPVQQLCWALSLHRMGKEPEARYRLAKLMLSNLYVIPHILGRDIAQYDMWHSSNYETPDYVAYIPDEVERNIGESEIEWMKALYDSPEFRNIRQRHVQIFHELQNVHDPDRRRALVDESHTLLKGLEEGAGRQGH